MAANGEGGTVFHELNHIFEQYEDIYTVLIDDRSVVTFEIPRVAGRRPSRNSVLSLLDNTVTNLDKGSAAYAWIERWKMHGSSSSNEQGYAIS
jgi:hypothetical protein